MSDLMQQQKSAIAQWCSLAREQGWLSQHDVRTVDDIPLAAPDALFDQTERPLVAGLFGGTGVGKSSLLNRLAGEPVARTSAERPTSRDITVYVHRSVSVDRLPEDFPMERIRTSLHNNPKYQQVMFIDMPDFDSVDTSNRELVDHWLPHLDIILYVVSPERYRDDQGWRLLQQHAHNHGWIFVFNHWDRGAEEQYNDFQGQLASAGLANPVVFKTDCSAAPGNNRAVKTQINDEFEAMQQTLIDLSEKNIVQALQQQGVLSRLNSLKVAADGCLAKLADDSQCQQLLTHWDKYSIESKSNLYDALQWPFSLVAKQFEEPAKPWWRFWTSVQPSPNSPINSTKESALQLQETFDSQLENFINQQAQAHKLPVAALKHVLATDYSTARQSITSTLDRQLSLSLASPGNRWQQWLYRTTGHLCVLLPITAMAWIGWRVINGFIDGAVDPTAYLGSNFAVNAALLVAIAWLAPAIAHNKCKPSREAAALRGLNTGYEQAYDSMSVAVEKGLNTLSSNVMALQQQYASIWSNLSTSDTHQLPQSVRQLIVEQMPQSAQSVSRGLDVRANTHNSTDSAPVS